MAGKPGPHAHTVRGKHKKIVHLYRRGFSVSSIAKLANVFTTQVTQVLERSGDRKPLKQTRDLELEKQIAREYARGDQALDIAARHGVSAWKVTECVKRNGGKVRPRGQQPRAVTEEERAGMLQMWREGHSQHVIAKSYGMGRDKVQAALKDHGVEVRPFRARGAEHGSWKGGVHMHPDGYRWVLVQRDDLYASMRNSAGYVLEHRLILARALGRSLTRTETVHHIDGNKLNNAIENLQLRQGKHGKGVRHICLDCGSGNVKAAPLGIEELRRLEARGKLAS